MRVPVPCMRCKLFTMEMDMSMPHQHISCANCGASWCFVCKTVDVDPAWLQSLPVQPGSRAHLN